MLQQFPRNNKQQFIFFQTVSAKRTNKRYLSKILRIKTTFSQDFLGVLRAEDIPIEIQNPARI